MTKIKNILQNWPEPYSVFFLMGTLYALLGVGVWPLFQWMKIPYPAFLHISLMTSGFLVCFVTGFLLTAVPKFTGAQPTRKIELAFIFFMLLWPFPILFGWVSETEKFVTAVMVMVSLFLFGYYLSRRSKAQFRMPLYFDLVGFGLFVLAFGSALHHAMALESIGRSWTLCANRLTHHDFVFFLIVGIGSKMIGALLGWGGQMPVQIIPLKQDYSLKVSTLKNVARSGKLGYAFALLSFIAMLFEQPVISGIFQLTLLIQIGFFHWHLHQRPRNPGKMAHWLWLACWLMGVGLLMNVLFPSLGVHGLHLEMVGGFSLIVLLIASRVILAHGGFGLEFETKSKLIRVIGALLFFAALTRVVAIWIPGGPMVYISHLTYAALTFALAVLIWFGAFAKKIWP